MNRSAVPARHRAALTRGPGQVRAGSAQDACVPAMDGVAAERPLRSVNRAGLLGSTGEARFPARGAARAGRETSRMARCAAGILVAMVAALAAGCAFDRTGPHPPARTGTGAVPWDRAGWHERSIGVGPAERWYRLFVPPGIGRDAPVVVALHGGSRSMRDMFGRNAGGPRPWLDVAREAGLLLVVPNGTNPVTGNTRGDDQFWNDLRPPADGEEPARARDVAFIDALLDRVLRRYPVDPRRVYVTGASNGGLMAYKLLIERPGRFAAAAAFIAGLPAGDDRLRAPARPTPLLIANGTADRLMKWEGGRLPGGRGEIRSSEATVDWWVAANGARADAARSRYLPDRVPDDGCRLRRVTYPADEGGAPVVFLVMEGGGHTLPSRYDPPDNAVARYLFGNTCRDAEGARLAWSFMRGFELGRAGAPAQAAGRRSAQRLMGMPSTTSSRSKPNPAASPGTSKRCQASMKGSWTRRTSTLKYSPRQP